MFGEDSELGSRMKRDKEGGEDNGARMAVYQHRCGDETMRKAKDWRGSEVENTQTKRHVLVRMYTHVRMYVPCVWVEGWMNGTYIELCYESQTNNMAHVTVPVTHASSAGSWDGPHSRGAYPQQTKIEMVCSRMMMALGATSVMEGC